jgi:hypothetical protein
MTNADPEPLPPSTLPAECQFHFLGFPDRDEYINITVAVRKIVNACGRFMDLRLLEGITVGVDYDAALESVDLGYESTRAKTYTNEGGLLGVGKTLQVRRGESVRCHVVLNVNVLRGLADFEGELFWRCANIVAHELGHVATKAWFEAHSPGQLLTEQVGDWATRLMRDTAHTLWEEYAACRLSAGMSDEQAVGGAYQESLRLALAGAMGRAKECIKAYRSHGDVDRLLIDLVGIVGMPLKMAAYLMGHLDGCSANTDELSSSHDVVASGLSSCFPALLAAFRDAWNSRLTWDGIAGVDGISAAIIKGFALSGVDLILRESGSEVRVPYSADTMPNGDLDMAIIALRQRLGLEP